MPLPIAQRLRDGWNDVAGRMPRLWSNGIFSQKSGVDDATLSIIEPRGSVPMHVKARISGWGEPPNLSTVTQDVTKIQAYLRMAERGDTYNLFAFYRDSILGNSHIQAEMAKRKMVVVGQPYSIQPYDKKNPDDVKAAEVIKAMIDDCENWHEGVSAIADAQIWPMSCTEKIYKPVTDESSMLAKLGCRLRFEKFFPVNPALLSYRVAYTGAGATIGGGSTASIPQNYIPLPNGNREVGSDDAMIFDPDDWNADVRIYSTFSNGIIDFSPGNFYKPDPMRHVIFRESAISSIRDNMGGSFRSFLFWGWLMLQLRDWYMRAMQRFGAPFAVVYANLQQSDTVAALSQQLNLASQVNGMVLQLGSKVDLKETSTTGMSEGFKIAIDMCEDEISKVICGQVSSSGQRKQGGLGGQEKLQSEVRDDLAMYDKAMIGSCLRKQVFSDFLKLNGFRGQPPRIRFGGHNPADLQMKTQALGTLFGAGIQLSDEGIETVEEEIGVGLERAPIEATPKNGDKKPNTNPGNAGR
jgi:hypothetical protein